MTTITRDLDKELEELFAKGVAQEAGEGGQGQVYRIENCAEKRILVQGADTWD